jgi:hypothetical protein
VILLDARAMARALRVRFLRQRLAPQRADMGVRRIGHIVR